jgi:hypothetical protein
VFFVIKEFQAYKYNFCRQNGNLANRRLFLLVFEQFCILNLYPLHKNKYENSTLPAEVKLASDKSFFFAKLYNQYYLQTIYSHHHHKQKISTTSKSNLHRKHFRKLEVLDTLLHFGQRQDCELLRHTKN